MKSCILYETPTFQVASWGNGLSYALLHKPSGRDIFFQGEAAEEFRNEIEAGEALDPSIPYEDIFAEQWAVYAPEEY